MADEIARKIGWQPGSPFQFEVGLGDLSWGVCGVLCIWLRQGFWTATGIGSSVFLLGCAFGHIRQMIQEGNMAIYNAGPVLWIGDLGVPITILDFARDAVPTSEKSQPNFVDNRPPLDLEMVYPRSITPLDP